MVNEFLSELQAKLTDAGRKELQHLTELKRKHTGQADATLNAWDLTFYNQLLLKTEFVFYYYFLVAYSLTLPFFFFKVWRGR